MDKLIKEFLSYKALIRNEILSSVFENTIENYRVYIIWAYLQKVAFTVLTVLAVLIVKAKQNFVRLLSH